MLPDALVIGGQLAEGGEGTPSRRACRDGGHRRAGADACRVHRTPAGSPPRSVPDTSSPPVTCSITQRRAPGDISGTHICFSAADRHRRERRRHGERRRSPVEAEAAGRRHRGILRATMTAFSKLSDPRLQVGDAGDGDTLRDHRRLAGIARGEYRARRLELEGVAAVGRVALRRDRAGDDAARLAEIERRRIEDQRLVRRRPSGPSPSLRRAARVSRSSPKRMTPAPKSSRARWHPRPRRPCRSGCWRGRRAECRRSSRLSSSPSAGKMSAMVSCEKTADMTWLPDVASRAAIDRRRPATAEAGSWRELRRAPASSCRGQTLRSVPGKRRCCRARVPDR